MGEVGKRGEREREGGREEGGGVVSEKERGETQGEMKREGAIEKG